MPPSPGSFWRVGFSRVNWHVLVEPDPLRYVKDPAQPEEDNWVWSPQGRINMHEPEHWGLLQFALPDPLNGTVPMYYDEWTVRSVAMAVYWAQRLFKDNEPSGLYATDLAALSPFAPPGLIDGTCTAPPELAVSEDRTSWTVVVEHVIEDSRERLTANLNHLRLLTVSREQLPRIMKADSNSSSISHVLNDVSTPRLRRLKGTVGTPFLTVRSSNGFSVSESISRIRSYIENNLPQVGVAFAVDHAAAAVCQRWCNCLA
eukprot:SAG31_NODE_10195_length_1172_cov_1.315937_1_plen_259_part_10